MNRTTFKFIFDMILWALAVPAAYWLRLEDTARYTNDILLYGLLGLPLKAFLIVFFGLHRRGWRNVSTRDLVVLMQAVGVASLGLFSIGFLLQPGLFLPRSIPLLEGALAILIMGGARLLSRLHYESSARRATGGAMRRVVLVGAGEAGNMVVRELSRHPEAGVVPVGFLDDDTSKHKHNIHDVPVLGRIADLPRVVREVQADEILIAMPSAPGKVVRRVVDLAREANVRYRTIPGIYDLLTGKVSVTQLREVDVEDLLRREPVRLNLGKIARYLEDRAVLITGAGGSIGAELVNQVARFGPRRVLLLGRGENSLVEAERRIARFWPSLDYAVVVADIRDSEKIRRVFAEHRPQVVFHAAAHKHVPLMEHNPDEAVFNNVIGTLNLVDAARENGVSHFVNISTDKAVNPTSIMGATKRVAECVVLKGAARARAGQVFVSVRFGNVLGSRGSVIPLFREQIREGGPVTVTDEAMKRYFMTIPEAAQLVLQAGGLDMNGAVFVLDMGEPVKIIDLARDMIRFSGFEPEEDIRIVTTGIRPGEKLFEEYLSAEEGTEATRADKIFMARTAGQAEDFDIALEELILSAHDRDGDRILRILKELVPTFMHSRLGTERTPPAEASKDKENASEIGRITYGKAQSSSEKERSASEMPGSASEKANRVKGA